MADYPSYAAVQPPPTATVAEIVNQVKIQGVFDKFRRDCLAVAEMKPNYKRLQETVQRNVQSHLLSIHWDAKLNRNKVREEIREKLTNSFFLQHGVHCLITDILTKDRTNNQFKPEIDQIARQCLGLDVEDSSQDSTKSEVTSDSKDHADLVVGRKSILGDYSGSPKQGGVHRSGDPEQLDEVGNVEKVEDEEGWQRSNQDLRMGVFGLLEQPPEPPSTGVEEELVVEPLDMDVDDEIASNYIEYIDPSDPKTQFTYLDADGMEMLECFEDGESGTAVVLDTSVLGRMMDGLEQGADYGAIGGDAIGGDSAKASVGSTSNSPNGSASPSKDDPHSGAKTVSFNLMECSPPSQGPSLAENHKTTEARDQETNQSEATAAKQKDVESGNLSDAGSDDFQFDFQVETEGAIESSSSVHPNATVVENQSDLAATSAVIAGVSRDKPTERTEEMVSKKVTKAKKFSSIKNRVNKKKKKDMKNKK